MVRVILAVSKIVEARHSVLILAGERIVQGSGGGIGLTEGRIGGVRIKRLRGRGSKTRTAEMIGVSVIRKTTGGVDSRRATRKWDESFEESRAVHQGKFSTGWAVNNLRMGAASGLLDHTVEGVVSKSGGADGDRVAVGIPCEGTNRVAQRVAVGIISRILRANLGDAVGYGGRRLICGGERGRTSAAEQHRRCIQFYAGRYKGILGTGLNSVSKSRHRERLSRVSVATEEQAPACGFNGFKDSKAPSDPSVLTPWTEDANRNIGIDLGASDLCVLDFDKPESIPQWLNEIRTHKVRTSKGIHIYFRGARNTTKIYVDGCIVGDIKSRGGYVLGENSAHPDGPIYTVVDASPIATLPDRVSELVKHEPERVNASEDGPPIPHGSHDTELTRIAGVLRNAGMNIEKIEEHLIDVCEKRCEGHGSDYKEMCKKIARSIGSKPVAVNQQTYSSGLVLSTSPIAPEQTQPVQNYNYLLNELSVERGSWIEQNIPRSHQLSSKEPEWLIDEMIYHTGLHLFSGHKGSMKNMLTAMIAEKLCKGESFLCRRNMDDLSR